MNKKIVVSLLIFIVISVITVCSQAAGTPKIYVNDVKLDKDEVTVEILTENLTKELCTLGLDLKYDSKKVEYVSAKAGKDLSCTFKTAEHFKDESRVSVAILSIDGLKNNGQYYTFKFKVKDNSSDIDMKLELREACNEDGKDMKIEVASGKIIVPKAEKTEAPTNNENVKEEVKQDTKQDNTVKSESEVKPEEEKREPIKIEDFVTTEVDVIETIPNIIQNNQDVEIQYEDDFNYVVENPEVVKILDDGTIVPEKDGTSKVRVISNGEDAGTIEVEVENGEVVKVTGSDKILKIEPVNEDDQIYATGEEENVKEDNKLSTPIIIAIVIACVLVVVIAVVVIKKRR